MFDENPATASGPFPLIVLAHDLGSTPALYGDLAAAWAAAGFVVAAPSFPLSDFYAPGGPDGSDSINQPGDVRAVIDRILELSDANDDGILAGMIDPSSIGMVGHGVGAGTAAVLFANPCCLDERIDALIAMSLGTNDYRDGAVAWPQNRPLLVVYGDADLDGDVEANATPKMLSDDMFAAARAPKGLLTLRNADRDSYIVRSSRAFAVTAATTTDFWRIYLDGAPEVVGANSGDYVPDLATLTFITE
jgi:dienelactone hydrolase